MEARGKKVQPDKASQGARKPETQGDMTLEEIQAQSKSREVKLEEMRETLAKLKEQNAIDEWVRKEQAIIDMQEEIDKEK